MLHKEFELKQHQLFIAYLKVWAKVLSMKGHYNPSLFNQFARITLTCLATQPFQLLEKMAYGRKIRKTELHPSPVFILGHWRSGTTHLHYLLACDPQFGFLSNYQAFLFNVSLLGNNWLKRAVAHLFPETRLMDNMIFSPDLPAEEELPFSNISCASGYHSLWFPQDDSFLKKFVLFEGVSPTELEQWRKDYHFLLQKIAFAQRKPQLLLKNPFNTARIKELLELFPEAKFIHIYRNPYDVYQSTLHWYNKVVKTQFLQPFSEKDIEEKTIRYYQLIMKKYLEQKALIPKGNLIEVRFEDLETNPFLVLEIIYSRLRLDGFNNAIPLFSRYLNQVGDYQKNKYRPSDKEIAKVNREWGFAFKAWGYAMEGLPA